MNTIECRRVPVLAAQSSQVCILGQNRHTAANLSSILLDYCTISFIIASQAPSPMHAERRCTSSRSHATPTSTRTYHLVCSSAWFAFQCSVLGFVATSIDAYSRHACQAGFGIVKPSSRDLPYAVDVVVPCMFLLQPRHARSMQTSTAM